MCDNQKNQLRLLGLPHSGAIIPGASHSSAIELGVSHSSATILNGTITKANTHLGYYHSPGTLPHFDVGGIYQFITYHLADSLPKAKIKAMQEELKGLPPTEIVQKKWKLLDEYLDTGYGSCLLRNPECANVIISAWQFFHLIRYDLVAWVVMPNHVHLLIRQYEGWPLGKIVLSWKNYTARKINEICRTGVRYPQDDRTGVRYPQDGCRASPFWHSGYWDRYIRDENHFHNTIHYIHFNPVKAGLVANEYDWPWSSSQHHR